MADITAATVMKLRKMSGQGMMDCKAALKESGGDLDEAMSTLRKKGLATLAKRAGRDTTEGKVVSNVSDDGKTAAICSLCCETDFAAKSDDFGVVAGQLADYAMACTADEGPEALLATEVDGKKFETVLTDMVSKTGEKTEVGDYVRYKIDGSGVFGNYIHFNNKLGALVEIETSSDEVSCAIAVTAKEIAMHITATNPVSVDSDSFDPAVIEKEREIARELVKDKPAQIIDKIIDGKIGKFLADNCLVDQPFVKDDSMKVGEALDKAAKDAGGTAKIKRFVRVAIG
jgi:elongation factor Ts